MKSQKEKPKQTMRKIRMKKMMPKKMSKQTMMPMTIKLRRSQPLYQQRQPQQKLS